VREKVRVKARITAVGTGQMYEINQLNFLLANVRAINII